jgi:DMSO/TMAO reductase YedYZ molybdopterin-dependent catalytic subunit
MRNQLHIIALAWLSLSVASINSAAQDKPSFTVEGEVLRPLKLTLDNLYKLKQAEVKAKDKDGTEHTFKGVRLADILDSAGVTLGKELRGKNLA